MQAPLVATRVSELRWALLAASLSFAMLCQAARFGTSALPFELVAIDLAHNAYLDPGYAAKSLTRALSSYRE
jgi:hypothetical protein